MSIDVYHMPQTTQMLLVRLRCTDVTSLNQTARWRSFHIIDHSA